MANVNLGDAKAHLGALIEQAAAGEPVNIMRRGKPVAQLRAIKNIRKPIDVLALRAVTSRMPEQTPDTSAFIRTMRDAERY
ncbi:MAG: type II toxin-antitoxin system prevent-host-death family antitoxin [Acetobacteraceae bacterium]|nr:type II toxin-antitoxin system prevent-host-death family antitoxin [Acetobacteraceae bacterium]